MGILNGTRDFIESLLYTLPAVLISLSFHEFGHAYAAYKNGDPTAHNEGRMTLNPLAHIDIFGFIMMILVGYGWAKPVPVNPRNYRNYKKGEIMVSLAGVTMNLILAFVGALALAIVIAICGVQATLSGAAGKIANLLTSFIMINCALTVFNLLPVYPLDGFHVAETLLAPRLGYKPFVFIRRYGYYILIGLMMLSRTGNLSLIGRASLAIYTLFVKIAMAIIGLFV